MITSIPLVNVDKSVFVDEETRKAFSLYLWELDHNGEVAHYFKFWRGMAKILLKDVVLQNKGRKEILYKNGCKLDCTKGNLEYEG